jgi:hypothetical protein
MPRLSVSAAAAACALLAAAAAGAVTTATAVAGTKETTPVLAHDPRRGGGVYGPTIAVDPAFEYYGSKPLAEIAAEIRGRGFTAAQVIDTGFIEEARHRELADAFRAAGVEPVLRVYPPTDGRLYREHPEWHQEMLGGADGKFDWRTYLCPSRAEVVAAYADKLARNLKAGGYSGVQLAEIWFEQWGGPEEKPGRPRAHYACVCEACLAGFRALSGGADARAMLADPASALYFRKPENAALYRKWVDMRVDTVQAFALALVQAARRTDPRMVANCMFLSDARQELNGAREYQAVDVDRIVTDLRPDIVTVQDAWQDWTRKDLAPGFVKDYAAAYRDRILRLKPDAFLMSHADIGSLPASKRSPDWVVKFAEATVASGMDAPSFYEWSVSELSFPGEPR